MLQESSSSHLDRESGSRESVSSAHDSSPFVSADAVFLATPSCRTGTRDCQDRPLWRRRILKDATGQLEAVVFQQQRRLEERRSQQQAERRTDKTQQVGTVGGIGGACARQLCQAFACEAPGPDPLFVPTVTDVATSRELQWMVQPTVIASGTRLAPHPFDPQGLPLAFPRGTCLPAVETYPPAGVSTHPLASISQHQQQHYHHQQHFRQHGSNRGGRRRRDDDLNPADAEKRRVRRERNKQAAARCRNRRQELTERLQAETDELEDEGAGLKSEIERLKKDKERLQFILAAHQPVCKMPSEEEDDEPAEGLTGASPCLSHLLPKREDPSPLLPPPHPPPAAASRNFAGDCAMQAAPEMNISGSYYFDLEPLSGAGAPACALAYTGYPGPEGHGGYGGYASYASYPAPGGGEQQEAGGCSSYVGSLRHVSVNSSSGGGEQPSPDSLGSPTLLAL